MIKADIEQAIKKALTEIGAGDVSFSLEYPPLSTRADYASNAALVAGKSLGKNPQEVAAELQKILFAVSIPHVERVEVAGPGFLNFFLDRSYFTEILKTIHAQGALWGDNTSKAGQTIMVEHTQPNPFKPFHIGHLMSNTIGESLSRLMRAAGARVLEVNYQGDVGLHVAKALWALQKKGWDASDIEKIGEAYVYGNTMYEEDEQAKKEIVELNKKVYAQDASLMPLYTQGRELSLKHFEELYRMLGTHFDHYFFEGEVWKKGVALVKEGQEKGIFVESEGAVVFHGEDHGLHTRVFLTKEKLPAYEAKELGLAVSKVEYTPFDLSITTTAVEQAEYFKVVFTALSLLRPELEGKLKHVPHGMMMLQSGKMSSRKGNVITGESLLQDMVGEARAKMGEREVKDKEKIAEAVGVAAIKYSVLRQGAGKNIVFDPEKSLSLEGDSGPYLQYAHTRCASILRKAKEVNILPDAGALVPALPPVERLLPRFPEVVSYATQELEPHFVVSYLTELASAFNTWYASDHVLDGTSAAPYKLELVEAVRTTLKNGLSLLGCEAPEEM